MKETNKTMKFVQLNMWRGAMLKNCVEFLRKQDADIINLQEVYISRKLNIFDYLKKKLSMNGVYAKDMGFRTSKGIEYNGNAILTKHRIINHKSVFYNLPFRIFKKEGMSYFGSPRFNIENVLREPKNMIYALIDTPEGRLTSVSTHLAWSEKCSERLMRIEQARKLVRILRGKSPVIVSGDFNTHQNSLSFRIINSEFTNLAKGVKNTLNPRIHLSFKDNAGGYAVDHVLGRGVRGRARIVDTDASDHFPLIATIKF